MPRREVNTLGIAIENGFDAPALSPAVSAAGKLGRRWLAQVTQKQERDYDDDDYQDDWRL